jgi:hypothetical protein
MYYIYQILLQYVQVMPTVINYWEICSHALVKGTLLSMSHNANIVFVYLISNNGNQNLKDQNIHFIK